MRRIESSLNRVRSRLLQLAAKAFFHGLSKDTHWLMGLVFARAGYVVCNIS